tara:strand:+ start:256 stop:531 length:276 start_codon:yes stop_codon:yes gene_type:complete
LEKLQDKSADTLPPLTYDGPLLNKVIVLKIRETDSQEVKGVFLSRVVFEENNVIELSTGISIHKGYIAGVIPDDEYVGDYWNNYSVLGVST